MQTTAENQADLSAEWAELATTTSELASIFDVDWTVSDCNNADSASYQLSVAESHI